MKVIKLTNDSITVLVFNFMQITKLVNLLSMALDIL
jgi:hypothetical protein